MQDEINVPSPTSFTSAPLRNRIRVELHSPVAEVWALIGNFDRYPEYSAGLERVDVIRDGSGRCTAYVCNFRPEQEGRGSISHREVVRWYEPNRGYASVPGEPNPSGFVDCLTMVTLEESGSSTVLTWSEYYETSNVGVAAQKAIFEHALTDISQRLLARFGGRLVENYVEAAHAKSR